MTSIICPKCRNHISEYDLICLNCGFTITPEDRAKLIKEQEELSSHDSAKDKSAQKKALKHHQNYLLEKKLNKMSLGFFHVNFDALVVPIIIIVLIIIVIILMLG